MGRCSYLLFVEPRLIGNLDVVSVRVADVCREVVGAPFGPKAGLLVGSSSRVHRRLVAGPDSARALGGECDVKIFGAFPILRASCGHPRRTLAKQSRAVAVQFVICVLATSRRSIGA